MPTATDALAETVATPERWPLDRTLPVEVAGSGQGWFTRYRRWPVFSPGWRRGRLLAVGLPLLLLLAVPMASNWPADPMEQPWGAVIQLAINLAWPLLAGPWLAGRVRRQGWHADRERRAVWLAMAAVVAAQLGFNAWIAEPMKDRIAHATGQIDADGKRKRAALIFGVTMGNPARGVEPPPRSGPDEAQLAHALNLVGAALMTFLLAGGAGVGALRREHAGLTALAQRQALARAEAERREAELRLSVLAAQVEPHFLFNTLAGVRSAIATDPARASDMVDRLVAYLRAAIPRLRSDGGAAATLASQAEIVRAYLALMAARMPRLGFEVQAGADLAGAYCPPLMLISLAENAVKHGVEPKIGPALVTLSAARDAQGRLAVTVADDGVGFGGATAGSGLGLGNLRERLQQLYQGRAALSLQARPDGGVAATIAIPVEDPAA
jgi:hypothetical protein